MQLTDIPRQRIASVLDRPLASLWNDDLLYQYRLPLSLGFIPTGCQSCDYAPQNGLLLTQWHAGQETLRRLEEEDGFDREFGTETTELELPMASGVPRAILARSEIYWPTLPRTFRKIIAAIDVRHEDFIFVDIGSGKGRALLLASDFPFKQIIGVELLPRLHDIARKNVEIYQSPTQRCKAIQVNCVDATTFELPVENTIFYLFDPFERPVLSAVLSNIRASLERHPRRIFVIYLNPQREDEDLFGFLKLRESMDGDPPWRRPEFSWKIFAGGD